jgi:hypothetical protein
VGLQSFERISTKNGGVKLIHKHLLLSKLALFTQKWAASIEKPRPAQKMNPARVQLR